LSGRLKKARDDLDAANEGRDLTRLGCFANLASGIAVSSPGRGGPQVRCDSSFAVVLGLTSAAGVGGFAASAAPAVKNLSVLFAA
jgi:hypothetical protein